MAEVTVATPERPKAVEMYPGVWERVQRAQRAMSSDNVRTNECWEFFRGNQYVYRTDEDYLVSQSVTTSPAGGKPAHRVRTTRNLIFDAVLHEVSNATQRVPSYQVVPSTSDAEDIQAAAIGEKVAIYGHEKWDVQGKIALAVQHAVVAGEGFVWPFFNNKVGPVVDPVEGLHEGEIELRVYGRNQVAWEPGVRFEDSRWHVLIQARPVDQIPGKVAADAQNQDVLGKAQKGQSTKLALVYDYLEQPSAKNPDGRWVTFVNGTVLAGEGRAYPCKGLGSSVLHKVAYTLDADNDRDLGLVTQLLDAQRTYNDCVNKQLEWKNLALNPQVILLNVHMDQRLTDEPGKVYTAFGTGSVEWRPVPPIPPELEQIKQGAQGDIARMAAQNDIPSQVEAGKAIQALIERDNTRRSEFIARLASCYSDVMKHCLYLVQQHYTEPRLLKLNGRFGWDSVPDFKGADLRDQTDVRVMPDSIEPRTKQAVEQRVMTYMQMGWIDPKQGIAAIEAGTAEHLLDDYEADVGWAQHCIRQIRGMETGITAPEDIPQARPFDNFPVLMRELTTWMKSQDFAMLGPGPKEAAALFLQQLEQLKSQKEQQDAMAQQQMAQGLGMANAARPQGPPPMPSAPGSGVSAPGGTPAAPPTGP